MTEKRNDVVFRRIRGRIVPIRINNKTEFSANKQVYKPKSQRKTGLQQTTGGVVFATAGGLASGFLGALGGKEGIRAAKQQDLANTLFSARKSVMGKLYLKAASKSTQRSLRNIKLSKATRVATLAGSGALLGTGLSNTFGTNNNTEADEIALSTAGALGALATDTAIRLAFRKFIK